MLLKRLCEASGAPGFEYEVRDLIRDECLPYADHIYTDVLGNLIVKQDMAHKGPHIMVCAHLDEVALMITHIEGNGMLKFDILGGIDPRVLLSKPVFIGRQKISGVIGTKAIHLQEPKERTIALRIKDLYIDIGAKSREQAETFVKRGEWAVFATPYKEMGNNTCLGKAFDDRVGCFIMINLIKRKIPGNITYVFTVQEEVGLRGATTAAYHVSPDLALVLEATSAGDVPGNEEHQYSTELGLGPALTIMDAVTIADKKLLHLLEDTSKENHIPYQYRRSNRGGNDGGTIHLSKEGIPTSVISVPCRYIHTPCSMINSLDIKNAEKLACSFLLKVSEGGFTK